MSLLNDFTRCVNADCPVRNSCARYLRSDDVKTDELFSVTRFQPEIIDTDHLPIALTGLMEACGYQNLKAAKCYHYIEKGEHVDDENGN